MGDLVEYTKLLIDDFDLRNLDKNGQNFLVDEAVLKTEIENAELKPQDIVLDIGSGFGYEIAFISQICRVIAVEKNVKIFSYLVNKYELNKNVELINDDFLTFVPPAFTKVVSNPPYDITDRILNKLLRYRFDSAVMILPKSVSDDLCALSYGKRTKFSAIQRVFFDFHPITDVPKTAFYPQPRVTSRMVKMVRRPQDLMQEILKKDEMTVKNAILRTYQHFEDKTKRESRELLKSMSGDISGIEQKEIKKLSLKELDTLMDFVERNAGSIR